jgi:2-keto-4-pentenoate hydratase
MLQHQDVCDAGMNSMDTSHVEAARRLRAAYELGAIPPLRDVLAPTDAEGAYAIQHLNTRYWLDEGRKIVGRKIGLTAESVQRQLGVDRPDFGVLFDDMRIPDGGDLSAARTLQPKVEAEVAIRLARSIENPDVTSDDILRAADAAMPALEIVDSRIADWKITFADTVADNGSAAFFVLGAEVRPFEALDLRTCGMALEINGNVVSHGAGVACLGHPLNAAAWLARTLAAAGESLQAGDIILTGALGPMAVLAPGDHVRADIGGLGGVNCVIRDDRRPAR